MPPTEPVSLAITSKDRRIKLKGLVFTPTNWMSTQTIMLSTSEKVSALRFSDKHLGAAEIFDVTAIDPQQGRVIKFDRPMMPTEPSNFDLPGE